MLSIQVLILLDATPDEAMLSEGVAREVVNRIQKLRKKVKRLSQSTKFIFEYQWPVLK